MRAQTLKQSSAAEHVDKAWGGGGEVKEREEVADAHTCQQHLMQGGSAGWCLTPIIHSQAGGRVSQLFCVTFSFNANA